MVGEAKRCSKGKLTRDVHPLGPESGETKIAPKVAAEQARMWSSIPRSMPEQRIEGFFRSIALGIASETLD
jgi:hypothetical protein